ncbi:MAG: hypothetical protein JWO10_2216 [Microbacteriaceae bacterium]|nr:hypothetical protein [Microbacteriaceae bacterium]
MSLIWQELIVDCRDYRTLGRWWANALQWELVESTKPWLEVRPWDGAGPSIVFLDVPGTKTVKNRLHLDFVPDDQSEEVERLVELGATRVDIGQGTPSWVVLADPEGNEFCVLAAKI